MLLNVNNDLTKETETNCITGWDSFSLDKAYKIAG